MHDTVVIFQGITATLIAARRALGGGEPERLLIRWWDESPRPVSPRLSPCCRTGAPLSGAPLRYVNAGGAGLPGRIVLSIFSRSSLGHHHFDQGRVLFDNLEKSARYGIRLISPLIPVLDRVQFKGIARGEIRLRETGALSHLFDVHVRRADDRCVYPGVR